MALERYLCSISWTRNKIIKRIIINTDICRSHGDGGRYDSERDLRSPSRCTGEDKAKEL
jgi:hypothetical protein